MRGQCSPEAPQELGRPGEAREGGGRKEEGVCDKGHWGGRRVSTGSNVWQAPGNGVKGRGAWG